MNENKTVYYWKCVIVEYIMDGYAIHDVPIKIAECLAEYYKRSGGTIWDTYAQLHGVCPSTKVYRSLLTLNRYAKNRMPI